MTDIHPRLYEEFAVTSSAWHLKGDWFDVCSCAIPCPCEFAQAPTDGYCAGILAYHVRDGEMDGIRLDGLNAIAVTYFEGNIWAGEAEISAGIVIDERGDEEQRRALEDILLGRVGGYPAEHFAQVLGELRGVEVAPIDIEIEESLAYWSATIPGSLVAEALALTGPTTPPGERVQLLNPPGSEVGPGGVATWAEAIRHEVDMFGFDLTYEGRSSKHIPFSWSGP